ncbi:condensin complex subunit 2 isoform X2 [Accipiter gentilis]|uniref:condensin complex subunit 2 isoform X2 n=1 Tax=Astur gentilis TaxID=8957 RepID=UPI00210FC196|nr:condensin complex subunit 2 isoform X2 [Accipiter gentilis]
MSAPTPRQAPAASPAPRSLGSTGTPVLAECPGNDDERERRQRRRSRAADFQLGSTDSPLGLASPAPRQTEEWLPAHPRWTNAQISEHYSTCIKLSTENKITMKNAFGLHLIDYMTEILKQKGSEPTDFKIAAGTLDASAKIYAVRVDVVHADAYKVLGGLGKDLAPTKNADSPEGDSAVPEAVKRVQTKKKHSFKTIEKNLSNINVSEANHRCEVDPMFRKTAASLDECSTAGIFLTGLHTQSCHSELLFDSKIVPLPSSETLTLPNSDPVKVTDLKSLLAQCIEKRPICSSLAGFQFTKWDAESHDESVSALLEKFKKSDQVFNINAETDSDMEDSVPTLPDDNFNSDSPRSTEADKIGEFRENLNSCGTLCQSKRTDVVPFGEGDIGTMCLHLSMKPGEYSYFSPRTLSMWAGPEHWRFKPRHKAGADAEKEAKKRSAKKAFEINFDEDIDFEAYFRKTKASVTLAKSILESQNLKSTTLPTDFNYDPNNILQLFLKPAVKLCRTSELNSSLDHEDDIGEYDYNNPNDTSNFCPALQAADSDDDNDPIQLMGQTGDFNLTSHPEGQDAELHTVVGNVDITTYGELNLIAEPQKVNKIAIQYAKTAKKMDMKRLKKSMWDILTNAEKKETVAEMEDAEKEEDTSMVAGEKVFSSITKELLHRLPSVMVNNLSVPLAFACLLHLANEKNLKLEGTEDLSDVLVKQGN